MDQKKQPIITQVYTVFLEYMSTPELIAEDDTLHTFKQFATPIDMKIIRIKRAIIRREILKRLFYRSNNSKFHGKTKTPHADMAKAA